METNPQLHAPWGEYVARVGRMSVEQFEQFPGEDGWAYELHQAKLVSIPGPGREHGKIQTRLTLLLSQYLDAQNLGMLVNTSCYNLPLPGSNEEVLCPDLSYIVPAREIGLHMRGSYPVIAPDLVIEIASPGDTHPELQAKTALYLRAGVRLVWNVWPKSQTIEVWRPGATNKPTAILKSNDALDGLDVLPGFQCPVLDIFSM